MPIKQREVQYNTLLILEFIGRGIYYFEENNMMLIEGWII